MDGWFGVLCPAGIVITVWSLLVIYYKYKQKGSENRAKYPRGNIYVIHYIYKILHLCICRTIVSYIIYEVHYSRCKIKLILMKIIYVSSNSQIPYPHTFCHTMCRENVFSEIIQYDIRFLTYNLHAIYKVLGTSKAHKFSSLLCAETKSRKTKQ